MSADVTRHNIWLIISHGFFPSNPAAVMKTKSTLLESFYSWLSIVCFDLSVLSHRTNTEINAHISFVLMVKKKTVVNLRLCHFLKTLKVHCDHHLIYFKSVPSALINTIMSFLAQKKLFSRT